jgi:GNAT superfamily N-acetyltransferase
MKIDVMVAEAAHAQHAELICRLMEEASIQRGTGIAKRSPVYVQQKMEEGKAVIAFEGENLVGFCYIETWGHGKYVANSGLIVNPDYRNTGVARRIKEKVFELSRKKYPEAKIFGITTSLAVMRINSDLGYKPVTFSELTDDEAFWKGCGSCRNFDILERNNRRMCLCTGMLYDPERERKQEAKKKIEERKAEKAERWQAFLRFLRLKHLKAEKFFKRGFSKATAFLSL